MGIHRGVALTVICLNWNNLITERISFYDNNFSSRPVSLHLNVMDMGNSSDQIEKGGKPYEIFRLIKN